MKPPIPDRLYIVVLWDGYYDGGAEATYGPYTRQEAVAKVKELQSQIEAAKPKAREYDMKLNRIWIERGMPTDEEWIAPDDYDWARKNVTMMYSVDGEYKARTLRGLEARTN